MLGEHLGRTGKETAVLDELKKLLNLDKTPEYIWKNVGKEDYFNENYEEIYEYSRGAEISYCKLCASRLFVYICIIKQKCWNYGCSRL